MTIQDKAIAALSESSDAAEKLALRLRFRGKDDEADVIDEKGAVIDRLAEDLLAQAMSDWIKDSEAILAEMLEANKEIEAAINDIAKDVKVAEKVVKVTKSLDKVIKKVTELLA